MDELRVGEDWYLKLTEEALDWFMWRNLLGRGNEPVVQKQKNE